MLVYKFGGASVKSADALQNLVRIVSQAPRPLVVVVSAMGKTTNALEEVCRAWVEASADLWEKWEAIRAFHFEILHGLFPDDHSSFSDTEKDFENLKDQLSGIPDEQYDHAYDRIISWGEIISTRIVSAYLQDQGLVNQWLDARKMLITDRVHRDAKVNIEASQAAVSGTIQNTGLHLYVTQGFIGQTPEGETTTLGREGSDYTASILAYLCQAEKLVIWKDVAGIFNADPHHYPDPVKLDELSYSEAIELAYYGAKVIHPKTIKPLQNKNIPLLVKSFIDPELTGTMIHQEGGSHSHLPFFIFKPGQILLSISPKDFSFIAEDNLSLIFGLLADRHIRVNLMQNSAISFSVCFDHDLRKTDSLIEALKNDFHVRYNTGLELITIRNYSAEAIAKTLGKRPVLVEQKSRTTARFVVGD